MSAANGRLMAESLLATLGTCSLRVAETLVESPATQKARAILAYLAMHRGVDVSRERLLELFWPDVDPERGRDNLRTALWSIRRCLRAAGLEADAFVTANKSIVRWSAETRVDALDFERLAHGSDTDVTAALALYRGDFLEGDYDDWAVAERERLASIFEGALSRALKASPDAQTAQLLLARNPYDEAAYATLVDAELAAGRRMAALAYVDRCRAALREIGAAPSAAFESRYAAIARLPVAPAAELALPFVGRDEQLSAIAAAIDECERGSGSLLLVHGESGIGKSALLAAAARLASARGMRAFTVECGESATQMLGPWSSAYASLAGTAFANAPTDEGAGLPEAFARAIAGALGAPAVVIVDDAQALNRVSLDILGELAAVLPRRHVAIVASRPEGRAEIARRFDGLRFDEIRLQPLGRDVLESALREIAGEASSPITNAIYDRTGGHPLFVSAMLAEMSASGVATREGHRWRFDPKAASALDVPSSLRRHIEARLRSCGDDACAVACAIAVEPFATTGQVVEALDMPEERAFDALDELLAHGLIVEPSSGPLFAFAHDMIAEVAATLLNAGRRTRLHQVFAEQLQAGSARDRWLRLARHLRAAGKALDAGAAYHEAALEGIEWAAYGDVAARASEGVALLESLDRSPARDASLALLERAKAGGIAFGGDPASAVGPSDRSVAYARASGDEAVLLTALLARAFVLSEAGDKLRQYEDASEAIEIARRLGDDLKLAKALTQRSTSSSGLGHAEDSARDADEAYDIAVRLGEWGLAESAISESVYQNVLANDFAAALAAADRGLAVGRQGEPSSLATAHHNRAMVYYAVDRFDDAIADLANADAVLERSRGVPERSGRGGLTGPLMTFAVETLRALVETRRGRLEPAAASIETVRNKASRILGNPRYACAFRLAAIDMLLRRDAEGDVAGARAEADLLPDDIAPRGGPLWGDAPALARARVAVRSGAEDADEHLEEALSQLEAVADTTPLDVDRWLALLAGTARAGGRVDIADRAHELALACFEARRTAAGALWGGTGKAGGREPSLTIG